MNSKRPVLPDAIFLDTNALRQLYGGSSNIDFLEIQENVKKLKAEIIAPEIVIREWITMQKEEALAELDRINNATSSFNKILDREILNSPKPEKTEDLITENIVKYIDNAGIKIIPTFTNIKLEDLIKMAITHEAPFEKKDRGFKDTLILLTIKEYSLGKKYSNIILISKDHIFLDLQLVKQLADEGLHLSVVKNILEAKDFLKEQIQDFISESMKRKIEKIRSFLDSKFEYIAKYIVNNAEVSRDFVKGTWSRIFDSEQTEVIGTIKQLTAVKPKGISYIFPAIIMAKEPKEAGFDYVTFTVDIDLDIIVEHYNVTPFSRDKPKFPLSDPVKYSETPEYISKTHEKQETVKREISVEAKISVVDNIYKDLKILRILPH